LEHRYYLSSAELSPEQMASAISDHWAIENSLHWSLDVIFAEDDCPIRKDHAPQNFALLSKIAINLLRNSSEHPKKSLRVRRKRAGWDDDERMRLLGLYVK